MEHKEMGRHNEHFIFMPTTLILTPSVMWDVRIYLHKVRGWTKNPSLLLFCWVTIYKSKYVVTFPKSDSDVKSVDRSGPDISLHSSFFCIFKLNRGRFGNWKCEKTVIFIPCTCLKMFFLHGYSTYLIEKQWNNGFVNHFKVAIELLCQYNFTRYFLTKLKVRPFGLISDMALC